MNACPKCGKSAEVATHVHGHHCLDCGYSFGDVTDPITPEMQEPVPHPQDAKCYTIKALCGDVVFYEITNPMTRYVATHTVNRMRNIYPHLLFVIEEEE